MLGQHTQGPITVHGNASASMYENLSQVWDYIDSIALYYRYRNNDHGPRPSKDWVKEQLLNKSDRHSENGFPRRRPWTAGPQAAAMATANGHIPPPDYTPCPYENYAGKPVDPYPQTYKITATEYKRLSEQVRDVHNGVNGRCKGLTYKRMYGGASPAEARPAHQAPGSAPDGSLYHSQLANSFRAFNDRERVPYEPEGSVDVSRAPRNRPRTAPTGRARPLSSRLARHQVSVKSNMLTSSCTPRSTSSQSTNTEDLAVEASSVSSLSHVEKFYDTLTPDLSYMLSNGMQPESLYGDRPESSLSRSGQVSDEDSTDADCVSNKNDVTKQNSDDDSDEDYPEPQVGEITLDKVPQLNLRPEAVDSLYIPELPKGDRRKYDFDMSTTETPAYEFADPLSPEMQHINVRDLCSRGIISWQEETDREPENEVEAAILDRLMEVCMLTLKTEEWEQRARERARQAQQRATSRLRVVAGSRIHNTKNWKEKKCCPECLQILCVGDCPDKRTSGSQCVRCLEGECTGNCHVNGYEIRSRCERKSDNVFDEPDPVKPSLKPTSCTSCQSRHNAKLINANSVLLGRPKSAMTTYSRGQSCCKPRDLRPRSVGASAQLESDFARLTVSEDIDRPKTAGTQRRLKGRMAVIPHKSYFSQRRISITDNELTRERARVAVKLKRSKSAKRKKTKS